MEDTKDVITARCGCRYDRHTHETRRCLMVPGPRQLPFRIYRGMRQAQGTLISVEANAFVEGRIVSSDKVLRHLIRHSPTGMDWGYSGSGPADLARSILMDFYFSCHESPTSAEQAAIAQLVEDLYMHFKSEVIAQFDRKSFRIDAKFICDWLASKHEAYEEEITNALS